MKTNVSGVQIPPYRSAPVQREKVGQYREALCGVPEYRKPQREAKANQKLDKFIVSMVTFRLQEFRLINSGLYQSLLYIELAFFSSSFLWFWYGC